MRKTSALDSNEHDEKLLQQEKSNGFWMKIGATVISAAVIASIGAFLRMDNTVNNMDMKLSMLVLSVQQTQNEFKQYVTDSYKRYEEMDKRMDIIERAMARKGMF